MMADNWTIWSGRRSCMRANLRPIRRCTTGRAARFNTLRAASRRVTARRGTGREAAVRRATNVRLDLVRAARRLATGRDPPRAVKRVCALLRPMERQSK